MPTRVSSCGTLASSRWMACSVGSTRALSHWNAASFSSAWNPSRRPKTSSAPLAQIAQIAQIASSSVNVECIVLRPQHKNSFTHDKIGIILKARRGRLPRCKYRY